jgi:hypothetical protein
MFSKKDDGFLADLEEKRVAVHQMIEDAIRQGREENLAKAAQKKSAFAPVAPIKSFATNQAHTDALVKAL